jgi:hypothetical protein
MPATTPNPNKASASAKGENPRARYVNVELSKEQREYLATWIEEVEAQDIWKWFDERIRTGHTITCKREESHFVCTVTGVLEPSGHMGLCLPARASSPVKALFAAMFRDEVVLHGEWPQPGRYDDVDI